MAIQRWDYPPWQDGPLEEAHDGEWVRYSDHIVEVERAGEMTELRLRIERLEAAALNGGTA